MFTLAISCLTTSNLPWFMDLTFQVPMHIALHSIRLYFHHQSHPQGGVVFALALPLHSFWSYFSTLSSSILGTYQTGDFIFQCHTFLLFHDVQGILKARILKWLPISFSSGLCFVRILGHDPCILGGPTWHDSYFHWARQGCGPHDQFV